MRRRSFLAATALAGLVPGLAQAQDRRVVIDAAQLWAGRFHLAPDVPFGWIDFPPSLNRLIGLRWLARILYPDAFPEDLRPIVRDFYARCYHQAPSEAQLNRLLCPSPPPA